MNKKGKDKEPVKKKKAAKKPLQENNANQLEDFNSVLTKLFTPVAADKQ